MAALTEGQVKLARSWIGNTETVEVLQERFSRLGTLDLAITESLRAQLAALTMDAPGQFATPSGYSQNTNENIRAITAALEEFLSSGTVEGGSGAVLVTRLSRSDYR